MLANIRLGWIMVLAVTDTPFYNCALLATTVKSFILLPTGAYAAKGPSHKTFFAVNLLSLFWNLDHFINIGNIFSFL
jgi:hypothetical protein